MAWFLWLNLLLSLLFNSYAFHYYFIGKMRFFLNINGKLQYSNRILFKINTNTVIPKANAIHTNKMQQKTEMAVYV